MLEPDTLPNGLANRNATLPLKLYRLKPQPRHTCNGFLRRTLWAVVRHMARRCAAQMMRRTSQTRFAAEFRNSIRQRAAKWPISCSLCVCSGFGLHLRLIGADLAQERTRFAGNNVQFLTPVQALERVRYC